jgi:hypothetical protein
MAGTKVFTAGEVLSASDLNGNFAKLPYATSVGTATTTTGAIGTAAQTTVNVTFPASRFSVAPIVSAWTVSPRYIAVATTIAAGSATITVRNVSEASGTDVLVYYSATQMTSGTAAG